MSLNIDVNMSAYKASNRFGIHHNNIAKAVQRLTTGKKLNSAQDSPVDMAIHNVHNGRIGTLEKGKQNLVDAISMVQTAESAMARIDELLIQMKVIAETASTGTVNADQREILASEFGSLAAEIDRVARYTEFKGKKLINGFLSARNNIERQGAWYITDKKHIDKGDYLDPHQRGLKIHFGPGNNRLEDYYFIRIGDLTMKGLLGDKEVSIESQHASQVTLETLNTAMEVKENNRYRMGIMQNRLENSLRFREEEIYHLQSCNSILADADVADEMINFSTSSMLAQAASAMIAQANTIPQIALKLLKF